MLSEEAVKAIRTVIFLLTTHKFCWIIGNVKCLRKSILAIEYVRIFDEFSENSLFFSIFFLNFGTGIDLMLHSSLTF